MWTFLQVIGCAAAWGAWGGLAGRLIDDRAGANMDDKAVEFERFISLILSPLFGTYHVVRWALWRLSAKGRLEKRRRKLERQCEIEQEYDAMLEDLDNG